MLASFWRTTTKCARDTMEALPKNLCDWYIFTPREEWRKNKSESLSLARTHWLNSATNDEFVDNRATVWDDHELCVNEIEKKTREKAQFVFLYTTCSSSTNLRVIWKNSWNVCLIRFDCDIWRNAQRVKTWEEKKNCVHSRPGSKAIFFDSCGDDLSVFIMLFRYFMRSQSRKNPNRYWNISSSCSHFSTFYISCFFFSLFRQRKVNKSELHQLCDSVKRLYHPH